MNSAPISKHFTAMINAIGGRDHATAAPYQPKTGQACHCRRGIQRDNCPSCEGTGWRIDFVAIRARKN